MPQVYDKNFARDLQFAFWQAQRLRCPDLDRQQWLDLFAVWRDHYRARREVKAAETHVRVAELLAERDALFAARASAPGEVAHRHAAH